MGLILARRWYVKVRFAGRLLSVIVQTKVIANAFTRVKDVVASLRASVTPFAYATV